MEKPTFLDPHRLYTLRGFFTASGITPTRRREAANDHGVTLPTVDVGKRKFVEGSAGITYIKRLSKIDAASTRSAGAALSAC